LQEAQNAVKTAQNMVAISTIQSHTIWPGGNRIKTESWCTAS
jgi:hypothetical protein